MATKAERFRYEAERAGAVASKKAPKKKSGAKAKHAPSLARKAVFAFEETPGGVPSSRKSTRRSKHRQKGATALTGRTLLAKSTPKARHEVGPTNLRAPR
jgi:hypothetical protein